MRSARIDEGSAVVAGALRRMADSRVLRPVRTSRPFRMIRRTWRRPMTARETLRVVGALEAAGLEVWLAGGWGVDALLGRRTRVHEDLDLVCEEDSETERRSREILLALGYGVIDAPDGGVYMPRRIVVRDRRGRTVDLHPLPIGSPNPSLPLAYTHQSFATGSIRGRQVGCLTAEVQLQLHAGYELRRQDRRDVQLLREHLDLTAPDVAEPASRRENGLRRMAARVRRHLPRPPGGESAVVVLVPAFEAALADLRARFGIGGPPGMPAHITVLYPFLPPRRARRAVAELAEVAASIPAFRCTLARVGRFPGVVYAAPEPAGPLVELTIAISSRWPSHPPYGGRYPDIVPHCTVSEGAEPAGLVDELARRLPVEAVVGELALMVSSGGSWRPVASVPLAR